MFRVLVLSSFMFALVSCKSNIKVEISSAKSLVDENLINISNLAISNKSPSSFTVTVDFTGDINSDATVTLYYCNDTDSPGCDPLAGSSLVMTRGGSNYVGAISGLSSPDDLGDLLNTRVVALDDGNTSTLSYTGLDLITDSISFSNLSIVDITPTSFVANVRFSGDNNSNSVVRIYYCNQTDSPGCTISSGSSSIMTRATGIYSTSVSGLAAPNDPGDEIKLQVIATDADGATNSNVVVINLRQHIYRSIGPGNTSSLTSGGSIGNLTIAANVATFAGTPPSNVGVGDAIQYDSDNNGSIDSIAFIHARLNSQTFNVKSSSGSNATATIAADADWEIFRAYTSLTGGHTGSENSGIDASVINFDTFSSNKNLTTLSEIWNLALYGDAADTTINALTGWTTGATTYLRIFSPVGPGEVGISQRHSGTYNTSKARMEPPTYPSYIISLSGSTALNIRIEGLQFLWPQSNSNARAINSRYANIGAEYYISDNIFKKTGSGGNIYGIQAGPFAATAPVFKIYNNIFYDFSSGGALYLGDGDTNGTGSYYAYNNTFDNCGYGILLGAIGTPGTYVSKNNLGQNCTTACFSGTFDATSNYNLSNLSDAPGANSRDTSSVNFVNSVGEDYHLDAGDIEAYNNGVDLSTDINLRIFNDIDGELRNSSVDIGADER